MTPQEKAKEIRDKMYLKIPSVYDPTGIPHYPIAKEMALIAVDEILHSHYELLQGIKQSTYDYYLEVKREILKL